MTMTYAIPATLALPTRLTVEHDRDESAGPWESPQWTDYSLFIQRGERREYVACLTVYPTGRVMATRGAFIRTAQGRAAWNALHVAVTGERPGWNDPVMAASA